MKTLKKISIILALSLGTGMLGSCKDYLDVSDDLAAELTQEEVFNNVGYARRFHRYIYTGIPDVSNIILNSSYAGLTGLDNPWGAVSDELKCAHNNVKDLASPAIMQEVPDYPVGACISKSAKPMSSWNMPTSYLSRGTKTILMRRT